MKIELVCQKTYNNIGIYIYCILYLYVYINNMLEFLYYIFIM